MREQNWREETWQALGEHWDMVIIGGGITGAGILKEAVRHGLRALLVEQRDFAWGTSSRSSKLVHGGLRYLAEGKLGLMRDSVTEREQLLQEGPGLIDPLGFLMTIYRDNVPGRWGFEVALTVYDLVALRWGHHYYDAQDFHMFAPHLSTDELVGGFRFGDAQTDDARLVLRVIQEAVQAGGAAMNYARVETLLRDAAGKVNGVRLRDLVSDRTAEVRARAVINATGAWADQLREQVGGRKRIRPLRGSHLVFPAWRLPVAEAISLFHPLDRRPVSIVPWEGITLVGTTDVDHDEDLNMEPGISGQEVAYLMAAVEACFPSLGITLDDVMTTFAGVRPVIGTGKADPSKESRDHVVWQEEGLLTVTGGKLTTFQIIAQDALRALHLAGIGELRSDQPVLEPVSLNELKDTPLDEAACRRLLGRHGNQAAELVKAVPVAELEKIPGTPYLWAELRWAARHEHVVHLDDLMLRRVRLGLLLPRGGEDLLPQVRQVCQAELDWDDSRWEQEIQSYRQLWQRCYSLPEREEIPDWRAWLAEARLKRVREAELRAERAGRRLLAQRKVWVAAGIAGLAAACLTVYWLRQRKRSWEGSDE